MEIKLSQGEVNNFAEDVYNIIKEIPIYYLNEIIENAVEERKKEGEIEHIDYVYKEYYFLYNNYNILYFLY